MEARYAELSEQCDEKVVLMKEAMGSAGDQSMNIQKNFEEHLEKQKNTISTEIDRYKEAIEAKKEEEK